ncbi:metal-dependent hydrolase [Streptomyces sp. NPDC058678]|uniref:metal-dependent hydrolase n=1 Tax=Streptomyces sp. NPDC058678 TaxID=3346595 RepID=UPI0036559864
MSGRIAPREVAFDRSRTPLHRIPGEPTATHVIDALHLLPPAGERRFVRVFKEGLPLVRDAELNAQRLDTAAFTRHVDVLFRYARRLAGMAVTAPVMLYLWVWGTAYLIRHDQQLAGRLHYSLAKHEKAVRESLLPAWREPGAAIPRCFRASYHPAQERAFSRAVEYLGRPPAARAVS